MIRGDAILVLLAGAHAGALAAVPAAPVVALGLWWNANTISHNFIHNPFFRSRAANGLFSAFLSVLLGIPQALWRDRHLSHHAGACAPLRLTAPMAIETALVLALWGALTAWAPAFFLYAYLPGYAAGLVLCFLQGHYEHARGTISHHGRLYNLLFFNDGYHASHHAEPGRHWTRLREGEPEGTVVSRWPAVLRWLDAFSLDGLERWVLRSQRLQRFVLDAHERAFRRLLRKAPPVRTIGIVGGGLYPRTALILSRLLPDARLVLIDASEEHLREARSRLGDTVEYQHRFFRPGSDCPFDLVVIPLAFRGDRAAIYRWAPVPVAVHDWIWSRRGESALVSVALLKRVNLVMP